jgi:AraC-like DNA-binding protein
MKALCDACAKSTGFDLNGAQSNLANGGGAALKNIEQSIVFMLQHLDQPLQVSTLAAIACVSPSHYFNLFKRRTGCAPIDFFIRLRMRHASHLLKATLLSVKEIAAALGYDDPFYFSRVFKSVYQVAPSHYRHQLGSEYSAPLPQTSPDDADQHASSNYLPLRGVAGLDRVGGLESPFRRLICKEEEEQ